MDFIELTGYRVGMLSENLFYHLCLHPVKTASRIGTGTDIVYVFRIERGVF